MRNSTNLIFHLVLALLFFQSQASDKHALAEQRSFEKGLNFYIKNDMTAALQEFNIALQNAPDDAVILHARANTLSEIGEYQAAVQDYSKAISISPLSGIVYGKRAWAYKHLGQDDLAAKDLKRCYQLLRPGLDARFSEFSKTN